MELLSMKSLLAKRYLATWKRILARIVSGHWRTPTRPMPTAKRQGVCLGADTWRTGLPFRPSREADFLHDCSGARGVSSLIFTGYDSLASTTEMSRSSDKDFNDTWQETRTTKSSSLAGEFGGC